MAITTISQLRAKLDEPAQYVAIRSPNASNASGAYFACFTANQGFPVGIAPSSGVAGDVPTNATAGAFPIPVAVSGNIYLIDANIRGFWPGTLLMYDRLWHNSGLAVTTTTAQTVNSVTLPTRANGGVGAELWLDSYLAMGAGNPTTATVTYTNPSSVGSRIATIGNTVASATAGRTFPFTLNAGDNGIQSIQDFTLGTSRTTGTHGLVLRRPLAKIPLAGVTSQGKVDVFDLPLIQVPSDACIEFLFITGGLTATTNNLASGTFNFVEA